MVYMVKAYGTKTNGWYLRNLRTIVNVGTNSRAYSIFNLNMEHSRHLYSLRRLEYIPESVVALSVVGNIGKNLRAAQRTIDGLRNVDFSENVS